MLGFILSASLFLNDNDDIKYWIEIRKFYLQNNEKDIADRINPYALLEINRLAIESGHLNDKELIQVMYWV